MYCPKCNIKLKVSCTYNMQDNIRYRDLICPSCCMKYSSKEFIISQEEVGLSNARTNRYIKYQKGKIT